MTIAIEWKAGCAALLFFVATARAEPSITLSKKVGPPTSKILVSGSGFEPNTGVDIYFDTKDEALVVTNGNGEFHRAAIHSPAGAQPGLHWVTALERSNDKGDQKSFVVNTDWALAGFDASISGFNPYENTLDGGNVVDLKLDWAFTVSTYSGAFSRPVLSGGVVYSAFEGTEEPGLPGGPMLYALDAENGKVLWSYPGAIGTPAAVGGVVYADACTQIDALDSHSGALLWSYEMLNLSTCTTTAPTVADGEVFVAASNDTLYALAAKTGELVWSYKPSDDYSYSFSPAVIGGTIYACDIECFALNEQTGTLLWTYTLPCCEAAEGIAVAQGLVFIEQDGSVYALDAATGFLVWQDAVDSFSGVLAVANGICYGSGGDGLVALDPNTGALLWQSPTGEISSAAVANGVVYPYYLGATIFALDAEKGDVLWTYTTGTAGLGGLIVADGRIFASSYTGGSDAVAQIYAFRLGPENGMGTRRTTDRPAYSVLRRNQPPQAVDSHDDTRF
jgi:outer membrane protein assembly factor BamB